MSSFQTHMLIGALAGLALGRALDAAGIGLIDTSMVPHIGAAPWLSSAVTSVPLMGISALLATVPDIDEPGSFIAPCEKRSDDYWLASLIAVSSMLERCNRSTEFTQKQTVSAIASFDNGDNCDK